MIIVVKDKQDDLLTKLRKLGSRATNKTKMVVCQGRDIIGRCETD